MAEPLSREEWGQFWAASGWDRGDILEVARRYEITLSEHDDLAASVVREAEKKIQRAEAVLREALPLLHEASLFADEHGAQTLASRLHRMHEEIARAYLKEARDG